MVKIIEGTRCFFNNLLGYFHMKSQWLWFYSTLKSDLCEIVHIATKPLWHDKIGKMWLHPNNIYFFKVVFVYFVTWRSPHIVLLWHWWPADVCRNISGDTPSLCLKKCPFMKFSGGGAAIFGLEPEPPKSSNKVGKLLNLNRHLLLFEYLQ